MSVLATVDSSRTSAHRERAAEDWYVEPRFAIDMLLDAEPFPGPVLDPACGGGNIVDACLARGIEAHGSDLVDRAAGRFLRADFLHAPDLPGDVFPGSIICNPPYALAEQFVDRALALARHKVAVLVRLAFLEGVGRRQRLFENSPPSQIWVFSPRVSMPPGGRDIVAKGGAVAFCWLVWRRGYEGLPTLGWLPAKAPTA